MDDSYSHLKQVFQSEFKKYNAALLELGDVSTSTAFQRDRSEHFLTFREDNHHRICAEVQQLKSTPASALPADKVLLFGAGMQRLQYQIDGSKQLLQYLKTRKNELEENTLDLQLEEERRILSIVQDKCREDGIDIAVGAGDIATPAAETEDISSDNTLQKTHVRLLEDQLKELNKLKDSRMSQLSKFLGEHFPAPSENDVEVLGPDIFNFLPRRSCKSLAAIIQNLVAAYLDNPHDSWVVIDSTTWGPHVQLLLRTGIAVRNPSNPSQMRLEKFCD